jgi:cytochrome c-type biogenesis protein CcmH
VLYEPPLRKGTWLLWVGPFLLLLAGSAGVFLIIKRKNHEAVRPDANPNEEW